jgi:Cys-tRNA synthase (O-phospho-L-seryl-tRNA:Cys-tRNA synthase)
VTKEIPHDNASIQHLLDTGKARRTSDVRLPYPNLKQKDANILDLAVVAALATGATVAEVIASLGVSKRRAQKWSKLMRKAGYLA